MNVVVGEERANGQHFVILLYAVALGLCSGLLRAKAHHRPYILPAFQAEWLILIGFLPQLIAFYLPVVRRAVPDGVAATGLITSQLLFFAYVVVNLRQNRRLFPLWVLGTGLALNLLVIVANGGLMPMSPETVQKLDADVLSRLVEGERLGATKDRLLQKDDTILASLSDRYVFPAWIPHRVAFSFGDILIAGGAFWLLWRSGGPVSIRHGSTLYHALVT